MIDALQAAKDLVTIIQSKGYTTYFAGGWVRDHLLNHPSDDIDIVTSAPVESLQKLFPKTIPVGIAFGIIIVVHQGHSFEVATFRKEDSYEDGRRPTAVYTATPEEDALRRDFTINGMFYDPISEKLFDYVEGKKDLTKKVIRCIGNAQDRFREDRLRMIRAIRYSARFHFTIDPATLSAIKEYAPHLFPSVAIERVYNEFEKMAKFANFGSALVSLFELHLFQEIFPRSSDWSLSEMKRRCQYIDDLPTNTPLIGKIIEVFTDLTIDEQIALCEKLKASNVEKKWILFRFTCLEVLAKPQNETEDYDWVLLYAHPDFAICYALFLVKLSEKEKIAFDDRKVAHEESLRRFIALVKQNKGIISSEDLIQRGIKPGPLLGRILKESNRIAINEKTEDKEFILSKVLRQQE